MRVPTPVRPRPPGLAPTATTGLFSPGAPRRACVVIPAFNEGQGIAEVVRAVRRAVPDFEVAVVDDGSTDDTATRAASAGATVISLPVNLGIGGAVQTGFRYARRQGCHLAVQIDGDGQHDPGEVGRLIEPVLAGEAEMSVGSRWLGRGAYRAPTNRRFGMRVLAILVRWRTGQRFTDTTSGFRAVGAAALALFADEYPSDFPEVETLVLARRRGLRVTEVPVTMHPRHHGRSSIAGLRSGYYMVRVILVLIVGQPGPVTPGS